MTPTARRVPSPTPLAAGASFPTRLWVVVVTTTTVFAALVGSAAGETGPPSAFPSSWSNGDVTCLFPADHPAVTVSADGSTDSGLYVGVFEVDEVPGPGGSPVANASTFGTSWSLLNLSSPGQLALAYKAALPVRPISGAAVVGYVDVEVVISAAYEPSSDAVGSIVSVDLSIHDWPWVHAQDTLSVRAPVWPADTGTEHLALALGASDQLQGVSTASGATLEYLSWGSTGVSSSSPAANGSVPVATNTTFGPEYTTLTWTFGSGAQGSRQLSFDSSVNVVLPSKVLGIPLYDYVLVAGAAGMVSLVALIGLRHVRQRPSNLEFVDGEER